MPVKTITIDMEAYDLLAAEKQGSESFSKVIKRRLGPAHTAAALLESLPRLTLSEDALDRTEELISSRDNSSAGSPIIDPGD